ncbi:MAG TPA: 30S ribosomal protein S3 [Candidatus Nanoarchaeia archaeon]|nr:30S ribosomal protein S3 [Candidatus Nanoarchaeia archaeon]
MIEREFIKEKNKHLKVKEFLMATIPLNAGIGSIMIEKTPLGERITMEAVRPAIIIGSGGRNISEITATLRSKFSLENPQIQVKEIAVPALNATVMANKMANEMMRFGTARFKAIGYKALQEMLNSGALGAEIRLSGRGIPGARAQRWRFAAGYMKKCGQLALEGVEHATVNVNLHSGTVGIQISIMPPTIILPDRVRMKPAAAVTAEAAK